MKFRRAFVAGTFAFLAAVMVNTAAASADQTYSVDGRDVFKIGSADVRSQTVYHGIEQLSIKRAGHGETLYVANVDYDRDDGGQKQHQHASYTSTLLSSGDLKDGPSHDPDYLTILNQPFAVQLDTPTMRDLAHVKRPVPFDFPSPMTGAPLHGTLRRLADGTMNGTRVMGIGFEATGPLHGALPDRPTLALAGTISMRGTAYYAYDTALLLALDATLSIDGNLDDTQKKAPVSIVYERSLRPARGQETARLSPSPSASPR